MLVGYNFTENFTVDVAMGIFRLILKVTSLQKKSTSPMTFCRNKESKLLLDTLQSKKNKQTFSGVPSI